MDVFRRTINVSSIHDLARLYFVGDVHSGEVGCHETFVTRVVDFIAHDPKALVITMGDLAGFIAPDDRRFEPSNIPRRISAADLADWGNLNVECLRSLFEPIRGRIVACLTGNHEFVYALRNHVNLQDQIASALGGAMLGYSAFVILNFVAPDGTATLRIAATHGGSGAATLGGKLNALAKWSSGFGAVDLYAMGHVHACLDVWIDPRLTVDDDTLEIVEHEVPYGVITGTALRTYSKGHSGYGERKAYKTTHLGFPCVHIVPDTKEMFTRWIFDRTLDGEPRYLTWDKKRKR